MGLVTVAMLASTSTAILKMAVGDGTAQTPGSCIRPSLRGGEQVIAMALVVIQVLFTAPGAQVVVK